jgi:hypothetical protein
LERTYDHGRTAERPDLRRMRTFPPSRKADHNGGDARTSRVQRQSPNVMDAGHL